MPYLARLGVSHVYASPIHTARPGRCTATTSSTTAHQSGARRPRGLPAPHGCPAAAGLGLVLDIVPNHMGVGGADNAWWLSVLEWGELSPFGRAFDIDRERLGASSKLIVPFLGDRYGDALEKGDLKLAYDAA